MKNTKKMPTDYEQTINLSSISQGSLLYGLARAVINEKGFYDCMYQDKKTLIVA